MKLSKPTIQELGVILKEEFNLELSPTDLDKFAHSLVGYFGVLLKVETRERSKARFGNRSASRIDNPIQKEDDEGGKT